MVLSKALSSSYIHDSGYFTAQIKYLNKKRSYIATRNSTKITTSGFKSQFSYNSLDSSSPL